MSLMAMGYLLCINELHWLLRAPYLPTTNGLVFSLAALGWVCYLVFHIFEIFTLTFSLQIVLVALISLDADHALGGRFSAKRWRWWAFCWTGLVGKAVWEFERWLFR